MFKEFFSESGNASMTRLLSFVLVCVAILLQITVIFLALTAKAEVVNGTPMPIDTSVIEVLNYSTGIVLGFGLGAKVIQKYGEKNNIDITSK